MIEYLEYKVVHPRKKKGINNIFAQANRAYSGFNQKSVTHKGNAQITNKNGINLIIYPPKTFLSFPKL